MSLVVNKAAAKTLIVESTDGEIALTPFAFAIYAVGALTFTTLKESTQESVEAEAQAQDKTLADGDWLFGKYTAIEVAGGIAMCYIEPKK